MEIRLLLYPNKLKNGELDSGNVPGLAPDPINFDRLELRESSSGCIRSLPSRKSDHLRLSVETKRIHGAFVGGRGGANQLKALAASSYRSFDLISEVVEIKPHLTALSADPLTIDAQCETDPIDRMFPFWKEKLRHLRPLIEHWLSLVGNPVNLFSHLRPLEEQLTESLRKSGVSFDEFEGPQFMISGKGYFLPGPPIGGRNGLKDRGRILENILLQREQQMQINREGTPVFVGPVPSSFAKPFVSEGYIFREDVDTSNLLLHGKNSHRLLFQALIDSLKGTQFEGWPPKTLLKMLVIVKIGESSLWTYLMDTVLDTLFLGGGTRDRQDALINIANFRYSCRDPFVFNSLLLCFGAQLNVPNLSRYLLHSHWKAAYEMVDRLNHTPPIHSASSPNEDSLYVLIMEALAANRWGLGVIGGGFCFSQPKEKLVEKNKYLPYPSIEKKNLPYHVLGHCENIQELPIKLKRPRSP